jgi:Arc/MetJ family transcription regulator
LLKEFVMDKTIEISDDLVKAAQDMTGETDERAAVETVVKRYAASQVRSKQTQSLSSYAGKFEFADGYDVLKERGTRGLPD